MARNRRVEKRLIQCLGRSIGNGAETEAQFNCRGLSQSSPLMNRNMKNNANGINKSPISESATCPTVRIVRFEEFIFRSNS